MALCIVVGFSSVASSARADQTTGTWTGTIEGRGNYYWERSTRVVVPVVKVGIESPNGVRVGAGYLLDVITSASIAQTGGDSDGLFTELRHAVNADVGKEFDLGSSELDVSLSGTYSTEDDYQSFVYGVASSLTLAEKTTTLSLIATRVQDSIQSNADATFDESLSGFTTGVGIQQVVNPRLVLMLNYQFGYLQGFLANAYRRALIGPLPTAERHPDTRLRHAVLARAAWMVPNSNTSIHLLLGGYADSWEIAAIDPELRVFQQVGPDLLLSGHYRFYTQTGASFERARCGAGIPADAPGCNGPVGSYPRDWTGPVTNDPKMSPFQTHTFGLSVEYQLSFLASSVFDFAKGAWIDVGVDRYLSTSTFGNGWIGTAGGRLAF